MTDHLWAMLEALPSAGPIGFGHPDWCSEHGDIPTNMSISGHINSTHDMTYDEWSMLDEMRGKRSGEDPFARARRLHTALVGPATEQQPADSPWEKVVAATDGHQIYSISVHLDQGQSWTYIRCTCGNDDDGPYTDASEFTDHIRRLVFEALKS